MGGCYEETTIEAKSRKELKEKYDALVAHEAYMHGHGGYSGSFAEKYELRIIYDINDPITEERAYEHCVDKNEKWGPSFAYYLGNNKWYVGGWCSS